jgi:hypothetical protein
VTFSRAEDLKAGILIDLPDPLDVLGRRSELDAGDGLPERHERRKEGMWLLARNLLR